MYDRIFCTHMKGLNFYMNNSNYQLFLQAKQLIKERNYLSSIKVLRDIIRVEPYDCVVKFELAKLLIKNNKTKTEGKNLL